MALNMVQFGLIILGNTNYDLHSSGARLPAITSNTVRGCFDKNDKALMSAHITRSQDRTWECEVIESLVLLN